jgi:UDP-N-acetylmuramate--alanine ligase
MKKAQKNKESSVQAIHFIGIGGIGMSALAQYYASEGWRVTGSDAVTSEITNDLKKKKIRIYIGQNRENVKKPNLVIYSAAVGEKSPERAEARKRRIPQMSYAEALGGLTKQYTTIAIAGSHGKSTTTAMMAAVLMKAGFDPTVIVGTKTKELKGNFRKGKSDWLIIEADEYNRSFHYYYPDVAVVTCVDKEHLDTYKDYKGVVAGFGKFLKNVAPDGIVVINASDKGAREAAKKTKAKVVLYNRTPIKKRKLSVMGRHNQENAEAVAKVAKALGISQVTIDQALASYKGAWRRLERIKAPRNVFNADVYSDYAHHPTEIQATLGALREHHPNRKIICVFQPHQQDRFNRLFEDFKKTLSKAIADLTIVLPIYVVAGREEEIKGRTAKELVEELNHPGVLHFNDLAEIMFSLDMFSLERPIVVFMSAGDLDQKLRDYCKK